MKKLIRIGILLLCVGHASASERQLILKPEGSPIQKFNETQLMELFELKTLSVFDIQYQAEHRYQGVDLRQVLAYGGFELGQALLLKAVDGYSIAFDSSLLMDQSLEALIALRDLNAPEGKNFEPYLHGRGYVDFSPFYIVWRRNTETAPGLEELPWPYQMDTIEVAGATYYSAISPPEKHLDGFEQYVSHCAKCHSLRGVGGSLGPAIDRVNGMASMLSNRHLAQLITRVNDFFPKTKMPVYEDKISPQSINEIVAYLRWATQ